MYPQHPFRLGLALVGVLAVTAPLPAAAEGLNRLRSSTPSPTPSASAEAGTPMPSAYVPGKVETLKAKPAPGSWKTFSNSKAKVSFKVPPTWSEDEELASAPDLEVPGGGGDDKVVVSAPPWGPDIVQWTGFVTLESQAPLSFGGGDDGSPPKDPARFGEYLDQEVDVHFTDPDRGFRLPNVQAGGKRFYHFVEYDPDGGEVGSREHFFGTWHRGRHIWIYWTFSSHASGAEVQDYLASVMSTLTFD